MRPDIAMNDGQIALHDSPSRSRQTVARRQRSDCLPFISRTPTLMMTLRNHFENMCGFAKFYDNPPNNDDNNELVKLIHKSSRIS